MSIPLIDSHCHLFAQVNANALHNTDHRLNSDCTLDNYLEASRGSSHPVKALVVIEALELTGPVNCNEPEGAVYEYLSWLRIESHKQLPLEGQSDQGHLIKGLVPWAPVTSGPEAVKALLKKYKSVCPEKFGLIKGVRYLFQNKPVGTALLPEVAPSLNYLSTQGLAFDVGIDLNVGIWQFEEFYQLMTQTRNVTYVLNHLTKANYSLGLDLEANEQFLKWKHVMKQIADDPNNKSFMKLSGAFDQMPVEISTSGNSAVVAHVRPWFSYIWECFGPDRIIVGTDFPVCSLKSSKNTIPRWLSVVDTLLDIVGADEDVKRKVLYGNVVKAYGLDLGES